MLVDYYGASRPGVGYELLIEQPLVEWKMSTGCRREPGEHVFSSTNYY
jgi:hypothetical protein